jgi:DNA-binding NtrC family response regulator
VSDGKERVLVVDDDRPLGKVLTGLLRQAGIDAEHVATAEEALARFEAQPFVAVLTDLRMPGMDGLALLRELKARWEHVPVVVLTAHGSVDTAVEAMKAGAADFMTKPFEREEVVLCMQKALQLGTQAQALPVRVPPSGDAMVLGVSEAMTEVDGLIDRAAKAIANVLIRGESGTGKEVAARAIHRRGPRAGGPFVAVNCAALPDQLLESELFGYEKGAFTGATNKKPGRVELAEGGTLFLDEIGDVSSAVQAKLLRLLQEREYQPLGGTRTVKADVRFVAATHRDLGAMVAAGDFREDLLYRLDVVPITMPPLRLRPADIAPLAQRFCAELGPPNGRGGVRLEEAAAEELKRYDWPGNVRELQNVIERLIVFSDGDELTEADVARELDRVRATRPPSVEPETPSSDGPSSANLAERRAEAERKAVLDALERAAGNRTKAARLLGISRRKLYYLLDELELVG